MNFRRYWPLISLILVAALAATALTFGLNKAMRQWMHFFMGFFFCQFAMLKIFHPGTFIEGFQMYDLVAKKIEVYALIYPLIELGLGLAYLSFFHPILTYCLTVLVMATGAVGVIKALKEGLDVRCACMGTILDVPLSTVTLTEDLGMGLMALFMLIF
ncbi:MAG TPA: MauE/DoxX family redox-associated membrane protein [Rhabdochlamydiaceae bacterium]|nr:MauE/DoxX family redox-associated membrane protein [Rhabdochlamydiaceae bacterium]